MPLHRSVSNRMIGGVCGGIAHALDWDPTLVRVLYVLVSILSAAFPGFLVYNSVDHHALGVRLLGSKQCAGPGWPDRFGPDTLPSFARGAPGNLPTISWKLRCTRGT